MQYKRQETVLSPNGRGVQPYLSRDIVEDSSCPLDPGDTVVAALVPSVGVLLVPSEGSTDFEVINHE